MNLDLCMFPVATEPLSYCLSPDSWTGVDGRKRRLDLCMTGWGEGEARPCTIASGACLMDWCDRYSVPNESKRRLDLVWDASMSNLSKWVDLSPGDCNVYFEYTVGRKMRGSSTIVRSIGTLCLGANGIPGTRWNTDCFRSVFYTDGDLNT